MNLLFLSKGLRGWVLASIAVALFLPFSTTQASLTCHAQDDPDYPWVCTRTVDDPNPTNCVPGNASGTLINCATNPLEQLVSPTETPTTNSDQVSSIVRSCSPTPGQPGFYTCAPVESVSGCAPVGVTFMTCNNVPSGYTLSSSVSPYSGQTPPTTNTPTTQQSTNPTCPGRPVGELCYTPLEPLPGDIDESGKPGSFGSLLNGVFRILISLGGLVAVLSLVMGGIAYMTSDAVNKTEWARGRIRNALWGLFILITSVLLLQTINPQLLNFNFIPGNQTSSTPLEVTATQSNYQFFTAGSQFGQEITATGANLLDAPPYGSVLKVNTSKVPISNFQDHITLFTQACEGAGGKVLPAQGQSSAAFLCTKR